MFQVQHSRVVARKIHVTPIHVHSKDDNCVVWTRENILVNATQELMTPRGNVFPTRPAKRIPARGTVYVCNRAKQFGVAATKGMLETSVTSVTKAKATMLMVRAVAPMTLVFPTPAKLCTKLAAWHKMVRRNVSAMLATTWKMGFVHWMKRVNPIAAMATVPVR